MSSSTKYVNANEADTTFVEGLTDNKFDPELGARVQEHLKNLGLETWDASRYDPETAHSCLMEGIESAFAALGLNPDDPSTKDTPRRYACMVVGELTKCLNYDFFPKCTVQPNGEVRSYPPVEYARGMDKELIEITKLGNHTYRLGSYDQMVRVKDIQIMSLCEHHLQTIDGVCHIAYIPKTKVLGLSKLARVADFFARRPQIQERMTEQIFHALSYILETDDVAVVVDATHYCMRARGAMQGHTTTQTDHMGGRFLTQEALRQEFLHGL